MFPWQDIDTVLLDLDGTLLDLAFDTGFWRRLVPQEYGAAQALSPEEARAHLVPRFRACEGTLDWYCSDYWTRQLGLDIVGLHRREAARIRWLPGARDFVLRLRARGKRLVLMTNSHPDILRVKAVQTDALSLMDAVFSSHDFGAPKEDPRFWAAARAADPFDPARSLFVDDSLPVLRAAREAGIRWLCHVLKPDSSADPRPKDEFAAVATVADLD